MIGMLVGDQHRVGAVVGDIRLGENARVDHQRPVTVVQPHTRVGELRQRAHATSTSNISTSFSMRRTVSASVGVYTNMRTPGRGLSQVLTASKRSMPTYGLRIFLPLVTTALTSWRSHNSTNSGDAARSRRSCAFHAGSPT